MPEMKPAAEFKRILVAGMLTLLTAGCSVSSSTARRAGLIGLGGAGGGMAGYAIGNKDPVTSAAGAVAGAALTHLALGEDPSVRQLGFDEGYVHGQSDAIKRQYFLRHVREAEPPTPPDGGGETVYYLMPGPEVTSDGRKLEPHQVAVRVVE